MDRANCITFVDGLAAKVARMGEIINAQSSGREISWKQLLGRLRRFFFLN
jgi:hypothetical protein